MDEKGREVGEKFTCAFGKKRKKKKKKKKDSTSAFLRGSNTFAVLSPLGGLSAAGAINCPL